MIAWRWLMALNKHEREQLAQIARGLQQDDRALARTLGSPVTRVGSDFEWLVIATIAGGLALAALGVHWHLPACIAAGIACAAVGPIVVGFVLSPERHGPN